MKEINQGVVYVKGCKNGAIYDFNVQKVYSINDIACNIVEEYIKNREGVCNVEYLQSLKNANLISDYFTPTNYIPTTNNELKLEMAWLEVTQACNLKCLHCYEGNIHKSEKKILTLDDWKRIVKELVSEKIKRVIIIGGEPCCYTDICELINFISTYNIDITLFTNATLLTDKIMDCIINNKINVKVSVYGHKSEVHDKITTVNGSFDKLCNNIKYLIENGITVTPAVVAMKENQDYMNEIKSFIEEIGMKYSRYDVIRNVYGGAQNLHMPDNLDVISKAKYTKPNFSTSKEKFDLANFANTCWYGKIAIMENGNVIPCEFERNIVYGNLFNSSVKDILKSECLNKNWHISFDKIDVCSVCEFRYACHDCRILGLSKRGNIIDKNPRCQYNPYEGLWEN